jgi:hypothetical protein
VKAPRGTGVWVTAVLAEVELPADPAREVALSDVLALEEMELPALALVRTVVRGEASEEGASAELVLTLPRLEPLAALPLASAELEAVAPESTGLAEALSIALPELAATAEPAAEDEPAVFEAVPLEELLVAEDWI